MAMISLLIPSDEAWCRWEGLPDHYIIIAIFTKGQPLLSRALTSSIVFTPSITCKAHIFMNFVTPT